MTVAELRFFEMVPMYLKEISESLKKLVGLLSETEDENKELSISDKDGAM